MSRKIKRFGKLLSGLGFMNLVQVNAGNYGEAQSGNDADEGTKGVGTLLGRGRCENFFCQAIKNSIGYFLIFRSVLFV
jgi:hypothetical protein